MQFNMQSGHGYNLKYHLPHMEARPEPDNCPVRKPVIKGRSRNGQKDANAATEMDRA
jgi:hypothetical protein